MGKREFSQLELFHSTIEKESREVCLMHEILPEPFTSAKLSRRYCCTVTATKDMITFPPHLLLAVPTGVTQWHFAMKLE